MVECPRCDGRDAECGLCDGRGYVEVAGCLKAQLPPQAVDVLTAHDMLEDGILPVSGGWLDQCASWVEAERVLSSELARHASREEVPHGQ